MQHEPAAGRRLADGAKATTHQRVRICNRLDAGRRYRPEPASDAGITCTFVLRIGNKAAIEYNLGPDEMMSFVPVRKGLMAKTSSWLKPTLTADMN